MDLDEFGKFTSIAADLVTAIAGAFVGLRWWKINVTDKQVAEAAAQELSKTTYKREGDLPRLLDVARHNAQVCLQLAKSDEDRDFAAKARTLAMSCNRSRDVYLLRFVIAAAAPCRQETALLIVGDSAISIAHADAPEKSWDASVPIAEGRAIVSLLVSSGLAVPAGESSCAITSRSRAVVQSIVGYGSRSDTFVPVEEWDESIGQPVARSYIPPLPVTLVKIVK